MNSLILITLDPSLFLFTELVAVFGLVVSATTIVLHDFHKASVTQRKKKKKKFCCWLLMDMIMDAATFVFALMMHFECLQRKAVLRDSVDWMGSIQGLANQKQC